MLILNKAKSWSPQFQCREKHPHGSVNYPPFLPSLPETSVVYDVWLQKTSVWLKPRKRTNSMLLDCLQTMGFRSHRIHWMGKPSECLQTPSHVTSMQPKHFLISKPSRLNDVQKHSSSTSAKGHSSTRPLVIFSLPWHQLKPADGVVCSLKRHESISPERTLNQNR